MIDRKAIINMDVVGLEKQKKHQVKTCVSVAENSVNQLKDTHGNMSMHRRDFLKSCTVLGSSTVACISLGGVRSAVSAVLADGSGTGLVTLLDLPLMSGLFASIGNPANLLRKIVTYADGKYTVVDTLTGEDPVFALSASGESLGVVTEHENIGTARSVSTQANYVEASEDLSHAVWEKRNISNLTPYSGTASDGTNRLWLVNEGSDTGVHDVSQAITGLRNSTFYTVNVVVKPGTVKYAGLQFKTTAGNYAVARFDMQEGRVYGKYRAQDCGVIPMGNGLLQLWASFNTEDGAGKPVIYLQFLGDNGISSNITGRNRQFYFSECWIGVGSQAAEYVIAEPAITESLALDTISVISNGAIKSNNCSGIISFRYRSGISTAKYLWNTGVDVNNRSSLRLTGSALIFEKVHSGVSVRCVYRINWVEDAEYRVGWRSSSATGMELILNGNRVSALDSISARLDMDIGQKIYIGSDGIKAYSSCPISNFCIYDES